MVDQLLQVEAWRVVERDNYRQDYDQLFIEDTALDMQDNGYKLEWPIVVYEENGLYPVIDGHTRRLSALLASTYDLIEHKARFLVWIVVKAKPSDAAFKLMQLAANERRRDPDDLSKAIGYQQTLTAGATLADLVKATGHNTDYLNRRLDLLKLIPEIQQLVAKKQLPITYDCEIARLTDTNFQRIALSAYNKLNVDLEHLRSIIDDLITKESQADMFDNLPMWGSAYVEQVAETLVKEHKKTRSDLERELDAERKARQMDREYAKQKYAQAQNEIAQLRQMLQKKVS
jgi:ParB-like chromosome segregation protein Spo0J